MRAFTPTAKCEKRTEIVDGRARKSYGHRKPLEEWEVLLKDHHEGYIDWAEFERNQQQLAVNAYGKVGGVKSGRGGRALLVGVVEIIGPRFGPFRCGVASRRSITPAAEIMPDRCTPEYERTLAKMGALLPYRRARSLVEEFFPLGDAPEVETIRQRTMRVGARLERDAVAPPTSSPSSEAGSIALAIDGGHVESVRRYQVRSFEVFVAQVSNDAGKRVMFSSVAAEADRQQQQLRGVLHRLGDTANAGHHPERRRRRATIFGRGGERRPDPSRARLFSSLH